MRRDIRFVLAASTIVMGLTGGAFAAADAYYCPPGAKFCPAPGADNTVYLDTHFGMDAQTGEVKAYKGNVHPDEVANGPMTGEQVLYTSPPISVENRYVPYPGSPQTNMDATTTYVAQPQYAPQPQYVQPPQQPYQQQQYQPQPYAQPAYQAYGQPQARPAQPAPRRDAASEVANQQTARETRRDPPRNSEKIPWYKGGLWRNKKSGDDDVVRSTSGGSAETASASGGSRGGSDMWDDEEYTGYNPDGSVGRPQNRNQNLAQSNSYGQQPSFNGSASPNGGGSYGDPYAQQPYGQPQYAQAPYGQPSPQPQGSPVYANEPYTLPNSPAPTSPYQPGYVYPGSDVTYDNTFQGGYPQQMPAQPQTQYIVSAPQEVRDPLMPAAPTAQAPAPQYDDPVGSPQFENAKRLIKENRFNEAKNILLAETNRNPSDAARWRWLADCHYNLLELDDAINCYQKALNNDPNEYFALRGQGFAYLHRGHEYWRRMQQEASRGQTDQAAATFARAHEEYKKSLELLGLCLRRAPNDGEAIYGEAMAAEGASRKLYSNAISYLKVGPEHRTRAELFAENCITVINKGIERSKERAQQATGDSGPRSLLAGLYLRKAILYHTLGKKELALIELRNSRDVQQSILDEIDKNNATAKKNIQECEAYWKEWGGDNL